MNLQDLAVVSPVRQAPAMAIRVGRGIGTGPTELAAFDAALADAGVANYNLLCLSSVIPPNARIERARHVTRADEYGRRLYVVLSQMRQAQPGRRACAGIGWVQDEASGRGLFVELHGERRSDVERDIHATLEAMRASRSIHYGPVQHEIAEALCENQPVCALVIAVYKCEPW